MTLELGGLPVLLSDTAGLRPDSSDPIEMQGMLRAAAEAGRAQLQLWVYDASAPPTSGAQLDASAFVAELAPELSGAFDSGDAAWGGGGGEGGGGGGAAAAEGDVEVERLLVLNKADLLQGEAAAVPDDLVPPSRQWTLSCASGDGVQSFLNSLAELVQERYGAGHNEPVLVTRARHREHLRGCVLALEAFEHLASRGADAPLDLAAEELRTAATEIGRITGRIDVEELLDVIFRDFCIGK